MAGIVVPGVCRYTLNQTFMGHNVVNIVDMHIDSANTPPNRDDNVLDQAKILARQWVADIMPALCDAISLDSVHWVDLNSSDGATGVFAGDSDDPLPHNGTSHGSPMSTNVALLVHKNTRSGRGAKPGRMFVAGMAESYTSDADPNHIDAGHLASLQTAFASWLGNINQDTAIPLTGYTSTMAVIHHPAIGAVSSTDVSTLSVDGLLATQRRRLRH